MPPPSQLAIATSSVLRLLKEEASYHKELAEEESKAKTLDEKIKGGHADADGNDEYMLKQRQQAIEETKAVFGPLKQRIADAVTKLEEQIAVREETGAPQEEMQKAKDALAQAKADTNGH